MPLTGSFRKLAALRGALEDLSRGHWRAEINRRLGERALELVRAQFDRGQNPYGQSWARPKFRSGMPLVDSGNLRNSFYSTSDDRGFRLGSRHPGANLHNRGGTVRPVAARLLAFKVGGTRGGRGKGGRWIFARKVVIPGRQILPLANKLGGTWASALRAVANSHIRKKLGGRR